MKATTTLAIIWISVSVAVIAAIYLTGRLAPLWAFVIPALIKASAEKTSDEPGKEDKPCT